MTTLRNDVSFPGADGAAWPTAYTPSVTTTGVADLLANTLRSQTGNVGGQGDYVRGILNDAAVNGVADIGVEGRFDFSPSGTLPDCSWRFHLRSSNDWSSGAGARPATTIRLNWHTSGQIKIEHLLANGPVVADAVLNGQATVAGHINAFIFEVQGTQVRAKVWDATTSSEPTTGGTNNDGFALKATMATDVVTAGGRFQLIMVGPVTAGAPAGFGRIRSLQFYDFTAAPPPPPPLTSTFHYPPPRGRGRRR
jgi:hypothetical protein